MQDKFDWNGKAPENDGDFFYSGPTPDGKENIVAIVQITTLPEDNKRYACLFIPPGWRGDKTRKMQTIHADKLGKWRGQWAGPEFGLCLVVMGQEVTDKFDPEYGP